MWSRAEWIYFSDGKKSKTQKSNSFVLWWYDVLSTNPWVSDLKVALLPSREAYIFSCGRSSPIWQVSQTAKTAEERELTLRLAHAKRCHPDYRPGREVPWSVSEPAKRAVTSARTEQLARPKTRQDGLIREPTWRVSSASMRTVASARVQELSKAKQTVEGYLPSRETEWHITRNTLRAIASDRIQNLSKPIIRETMDHLQFNPDAFTVRETAKKATASSRVVELAQPIARGHKWLC